MAKLLDQELLPASRQDEYVRTHPLTRDRFESLKGRVDGEKCQPLPQASEEEYQRIKAKLKGYLLPRQVVEAPITNDIPARYARAEALYRLDDMPGALKIVAGLEAQEPSNPYFYELEGQILFDHGQIPQAVAAYQKAAVALPDAPLIGESYAQALLANNQTQDAIPVLTRAIENEPDNSGLHHALAIAYGRQGHESEAQLELAEEALLNLDYKEARHHAKAAKFPNGSPGALRAADIITVANEQLDKNKDEDKPSRH
jgi:predicted Zn-dependent protease